MGIQERVTLESVLSPEMAAMSRQLGNHQVASVPPEALKAPELQDLLDFWNKARDCMPLPCAGSLDPVKIPRHLSQIFLLGVTHDPLRFRFRIIGEGPTAAFGQNASGMKVEEIVFDGLAAGKLMHEAYVWIVAQRKPVAMSGPNKTLQNGYKRQEIIYLPFSDGGCQITRILGASVYYRD